MSKATELRKLCEGKSELIGYTHSGKEIYSDFDNPKHSNFSTDDHTSAMLLHSYLFYQKNRADSKVQGKKHEEATRNKRGKIMRKFDNPYNHEQGKQLAHKDWRK